jgi:hypothetical protein
MIQSFFRTWRFIKSHPLASRNKAGALSRWLRWQIGSRILKSLIIVPFVQDSILVVEQGMVTGLPAEVPVQRKRTMGFRPSTAWTAADTRNGIQFRISTRHCIYPETFSPKTI